jgi:hypothetical protein
VKDHPHPFFRYWAAIEGKPGPILQEYIEEWNSKTNAWWFKKRNKSRDGDSGTWPYQFQYEDEDVIIYSKWPYPGRALTFCYLRKNSPSQEEFDRRIFVERRYYLEPVHDYVPSTTLHVWSHSSLRGYPTRWVHQTSATDDSLSPNLIIDRDLSLNQDLQSNEDFNAPDPNYLIAFEDNQDDSMEIMTEPNHSTQSKQIQDTLIAQRNTLQDIEKHYLFVPYHNIMPANKNLTAHHVSGPGVPEGFIVWPLRISQLHSRTLYSTIVNLLSTRCKINLDNILLLHLFSVWNQTMVADIGFRYAEDAVLSWAILHGLEIDGCHLQVFPISNWKGTFNMTKTKAATHIRLEDRQKLVKAVVMLSKTWTDPSFVANTAALWFALQKYGGNYTTGKL